MRWMKPLLLAVILAAPEAAWAGESPADGPEVLPRRTLFEPLIADPRWPHYSAAWHDYGGRGDLHNVGSISLGDGFGLYRAPLAGGAWQIGLQAAVFAIFDLDAQSHDLVNADYWGALPISWRKDDFAVLARIYHQSSHLGDEFLLRTRVNRVNLSYEAVDLKLSQAFWDNAVRIYGGGGLLFDQQPSDLRRGLAQAGIELRSPWTYGEARLRPVAALDIQSTAEQDWEIDTSARMGVQIESTEDRRYVMALMLEYYNGRNPNGQFFTRPVEYLGIGLHVYF